MELPYPVDRLRTAIASLHAEKKPISAKTIEEECGLSYASLRPNPEALLLYQQHSRFLKQKRKRAKASPPDTPSQRDSLLAYKKVDLVARLRKEQTREIELETQYSALLQDYVQKNIKIADLEAEPARHCEYLEGLRLTLQRQEHQRQ